MIDLGKYKEVTAVLKLHFLPRGLFNILLRPEKYTFFYALKDAIDH